MSEPQVRVGDSAAADEAIAGFERGGEADVTEDSGATPEETGSYEDGDSSGENLSGGFGEDAVLADGAADEPVAAGETPAATDETAAEPGDTEPGDTEPGTPRAEGRRGRGHRGGGHRGVGRGRSRGAA